MENRAHQTQGLLTFVVLSFAVYWLSQWYFLMAGLSFLGDLGFATSLGVLTTSLFLVLAPLLLTTIGCAFLWILPSPLRRPWVWCMLGLPVAIQTLTVLLLIDNVTYPAFQIGIKNAGESIWIYQLGAVAISALLFKTNIGWFSQLQGSRRRAKWNGVAAALVLVSILGTGLKVAFSEEPQHFELNEPKKRPNVLFLASDGVPSKMLSG